MLGACHGLDVPLTFGVYEGLGQMLIGPEPTPEVEALSALVRSSWTAFASSGNPGWPAYDTERRLTHVLDAEPSVTAYPEEASRRLWHEHTFRALPLTGS